MLLFYSIPRVDTNETAHLLLRKFGSLSGVIDAPLDMLKQVPGIGYESATMIKFVSQFIVRYMEDYNSSHNTITSVDDGKQYMAHKFIGCSLERIEIACLNGGGKVLYSDTLTEGSPETVSVRPLDIIRLALKTNATAVVLAHNHPDGVALPSAIDMKSTQLLLRELANMEIDLLDHVIIAKDGAYSMRENGMI